MMKTIDTIEDLNAGIKALVARAPEFERVIAATGTPPLRRAEAGFAGVLKIIVGQQVSKASAAAIWRRAEALLHPLNSLHFMTLGENQFRNAGLSGPKIRTIQAFTREVNSAALDLDALPGWSQAEIIGALTAVKGIGPWTADVYLLSCLGRRDAWPAGDLALRIAIADILNLPNRPDFKEMHMLAEGWRPWRAVAARLIWAWYATEMNRAEQDL